MPYSSQLHLVLQVGEEHEYRLKAGGKKRIRLLGYEEFRDSVIGRLRGARVDVEIDGKPLELSCAPYVMPTEIDGIRIQSDLTRGFSLDSPEIIRVPKDVQLSVWDASEPIVDTARFGYPLSRYRLFSHGTQSYPEVVHMGLRDGAPGKGARQYHTSGEDYCGFEKREPVLACTDGVVVEHVPGVTSVPSHLQIRDPEGVVVCYAHLDSFAPGIVPGRRVAKGERIGTLGIQGHSGRFSHIHVGLIIPDQARRAEGLYRWWSEMRLYPWLITTYRAQHPIQLLAVARPNQILRAGEKAMLDGRSSVAFDSRIVSYRWELPDGSVSRDPLVEHAFREPGVYSAALWVEDAKGNRDVDFCRIKVHDAENPRMLPTIVVTHTPTRPKAGEEVTFRIWVQTDETREKMHVSFGDGAEVSDLACWEEEAHAYSAPGTYVVRVDSVYEGVPVAEQVRVVVE